jgi:lipid-binding SYLF domain-containing protein
VLFTVKKNLVGGYLMKKVLLLSLIIALLACLPSAPVSAFGPGAAARAVERSASAASVLRQILESPDTTIPHDILERAEVIAVFPYALKYGFAIGDEGYGVASVREPISRQWGAPIFLKIGGSDKFKRNPGGQNIDLVFVGVTRNSAALFLQDKFRLSDGIAIATGPVEDLATGKAITAGVRGELLIYARSLGNFSGAVINQARIWQDDNLNDATYGIDDIEQIRPVSERAPANVMIYTDTIEEFLNHDGA